MKLTVTAIIALIITTALYAGGEKETILKGEYALFGDSRIKAGISFPPFADQNQIDFTTTKLKDLSIDRIRIAVDWSLREPEQGSFNWAPMDLRMNEAVKHGLSVLLTIQCNAPDWAIQESGKDRACFFDKNAYTNFVTKLLQRYPGISKIQFGNEWESPSTDGTSYTSRESIRRFVSYTNILFEAVQKYSPDTLVVLGGLTRIYPMAEIFLKHNNYPDLSGMELAEGIDEDELKRRLDHLAIQYDQARIGDSVRYVLENARYDMIDIHLYDDPENWPAYLSVFPHGQRIIVSEFGGPNSQFENTSADYHGKRMSEYIDAIEQLPIEEAYYFKLVDSKESYHQHSGLYSSGLKAKPARNVFAENLNVR